jgi:hypothetical protein
MHMLLPVNGAQFLGTILGVHHYLCHVRHTRVYACTLWYCSLNHCRIVRVHAALEWLPRQCMQRLSGYHHAGRAMYAWPAT